MLGRVTRQWDWLVDKTDKIPAYVEYIFSPRDDGQYICTWTTHTHSTHDEKYHEYINKGAGSCRGERGHGHGGGDQGGLRKQHFCWNLNGLMPIIAFPVFITVPVTQQVRIFTKGRKTTQLKATKIQPYVDFAARYLIFLVMGLYRDIITVQAPQPPPPQPYLVPVSRTGKA